MGRPSTTWAVGRIISNYLGAVVAGATTPDEAWLAEHSLPNSDPARLETLSRVVTDQACYLNLALGEVPEPEVLKRHPQYLQYVSETHERCAVCGGARITVYPADVAGATTPDEYGDLMAVCECGAHYSPGTGWLDPEDL